MPILGIMDSSKAKSYSAVVLADNPLSFWLFNETTGTTATDQGSANLALTYNNGPVLNQSTTLAGITKAVSFDGTNDWAGRADNASYNITPSGSWSIEFWVKPNNTASNSLFTVRSDTDSANTAILVNFYMDIADGKITAYVGAAISGFVTLTSTASINDNAWHQIVLSATSGGTMVLYVDKVNNASTSASRSTTSNNKSITVAGNNILGTISTFSKGLFAANSIYTTTLSAGQVTAHYNAGV